MLIFCRICSPPPRSGHQRRDPTTTSADPATSGGSGHHSHGSGCGGAPPGGLPPPPGCGGGAASEREREGGATRHAVLRVPWWRKSAARLCSPSRPRRAPRAVVEKERHPVLPIPGASCSARRAGEGAPPCFVLRPPRAVEGRGEGVGLGAPPGWGGQGRDEAPLDGGDGKGRRARGWEGRRRRAGDLEMGGRRRDRGRRRLICVA